MDKPQFTRQQKAIDTERKYTGRPPQFGYDPDEDSDGARGEYGGKGPAHFPDDHRFGMRVPQGGSMCQNCEYLGRDGASCQNPDFAVWLNGEGTKPPVPLPAPADQYCCDMYEPGGGASDDQQ